MIRDRCIYNEPFDSRWNFQIELKFKCMRFFHLDITSEKLAQHTHSYTYVYIRLYYIYNIHV